MPTASGNTSQDQPDHLITVGVILGAHGSDGRVRVQPETDNPQRFRKGARLITGDRELHVERVQRTPVGLLLLRFTEVATRDDAAALHAQTLYVPTDEAPETPPDAYYHYQLVGMSVVDEAGELLGTLTEIIGHRRERRVCRNCGERGAAAPLQWETVIVSVDVSANRMTAAVPDGLAWRALPPAPREEETPQAPVAQIEAGCWRVERQPWFVLSCLLSNPR